MHLTHKAIARSAGYLIEQHPTMYPFKFKWVDTSGQEYVQGHTHSTEEDAYTACCMECGLVSDNVECVTLDSALSAIEHLDRSNSPGRKIEARAMLKGE